MLPLVPLEDGCRGAQVAGLAVGNRLAGVIGQGIAVALGHEFFYAVQAVAEGLMLGEGDGVGKGYYCRDE